MNNHVFFPKDLIRPLRESRDASLIGYLDNGVYVAVQFVPLPVEDTLIQLGEQLAKEHLQIIASTAPTFQTDQLLLVSYDQEHDRPVFAPSKSEDRTFTVILFSPPNHKNLEYFSIKPILLQSMIQQHGSDTTSKTQRLMASNYDYAPVAPVDEQGILDQINSIFKVRENIASLLVKAGICKESKRFRPHHKIGAAVGRILFFFVTNIIMILQRLLIYGIKFINKKRFGTRLVSMSQLFRQVDLRLKQLNYFPIQFLCFYDKSILYNEDSELLQQLGIPITNSDLNINNSNYINMFNSIWLILNDVLLGMTVWTVIDNHKSTIGRFIKVTVLEKLLSSDFFNLISWVSFDHPAGFKLNNELGSFLGQIFLWSINFWSMTIQDIVNNEAIVGLIMGFVKILCYGGCSLFICFVIDCLNLVTIHIFWSYHTSARIYKKQVDVIKSLFKLFHGKKYNLLRNRIDNLDNYSQPGQFYEVDQLLIGTLFFMILILLLPTMFAFYLTFFLIRLAVVLLLNFLENLLIVINFVPLFVMVLKLKNSNRLQGGLTFNFISKHRNNVYLSLSNKSLTYGEIFRNFRALFVKSKNFRTSMFSLFFNGDLIGLNRNHKLKYTYLMLPINYEKTIEVWKYFN